MFMYFLVHLVSQNNIISRVEGPKQRTILGLRGRIVVAVRNSVNENRFWSNPFDNRQRRCFYIYETKSKYDQNDSTTKKKFFFKNLRQFFFVGAVTISSMVNRMRTKRKILISTVPVNPNCISWFGCLVYSSLFDW